MTGDGSEEIVYYFNAAICDRLCKLAAVLGGSAARVALADVRGDARHGELDRFWCFAHINQLRIVMKHHGSFPFRSVVGRERPGLLHIC